MTETISRHVPIEQLQQYCREILPSSDPQLIEERLLWLLGLGQTFNFDYRWSGPLFRARKCPAEPYRHTDQMHYPPIHLAKRNRLNATEQQLLYLSHNLIAALHEVRAERGECIQILEYRMPPQHMTCVYLGEIVHVQRTGRSLFTDEVGGALIQLMQRCPQEFLVSLLYLDSFLAGILKEPQAEANGYSHSAALAKVLFEAVKGIDGVVYPSVLFDGARNIALKPEAADALVKSRSLLVRIEDVFDYGVMKVKVERGPVAHASSGEILWGN